MLDDPFGIASGHVSGSSGHRLLHLVDMPGADHPARFAVAGGTRARAQAAPRILDCSERP